MDLAGLQEDVCSELIIINNIWSVVGGITNNQESVETSLRLDIAEIWFDDVSEVCSCDIIIQFKELCLRCSLQGLLNSEEQATNVDSVKGGCVTKCGLISEEDCSDTRCCDERVNSLWIETISLCLSWVVCQFNSVVDNTALLTCR